MRSVHEPQCRTCENTDRPLDLNGVCAACAERAMGKQTVTVEEKSASFDPWQVRELYEAGVLMGHQVVRYGARGAVERSREQFGPSHSEMVRAATLAARLNGTLS